MTLQRIFDPGNFDDVGTYAVDHCFGG
jgi:hypothetical protein